MASSVNTVLYGSYSDLLKCTKIETFLRSKTSLKEYSLDALKDVVKKEPQYFRTIEKSGGLFLYKKETGDDGFDSIIYFNGSGDIIGYSRFSGVQGTISDTTISTKFSISYSVTSDKTISNSLGTVRQKQSNYREIGEEINQYASVTTVLSKKPENISSITESLTNVTDGILSGSRFVYGKSLYRLDFSTGFSGVDKKGADFENYQIGTYGDDVVLYMWRTTVAGNIEMKIVSLLKKSLFGLPIVLTKTGDEFITIPKESYNSISVRYCSGRYIGINAVSGNLTVLNHYNIEMGRYVEQNNFIADTQDPRNILIKQANQNYKGGDYGEYPDIKEIDTLLLESNHSYQLYKKCGPWFVFNVDKNNLVYCSPSLSIYAKGTDKLHLVSSSTAILDNEVDNQYVVYQGNRVNFKTPNNPYDTPSSVELSSNVEVIDKNIPLWNSGFMRFRRGGYPLGLGENIPEIIATYKGLVYYKFNNKINYI